MNRVATIFRSTAATRRAGTLTLKRPGLDYVTEARARRHEPEPEIKAPSAPWLADRWAIARNHQ